MALVNPHVRTSGPSVEIERSVFDRSYSHKTTFDEGYLIPFWVDFAYPGDSLQVSTSMFARLATQYVPVMDRIHVDFHFFAVPVRLLWNNWVKLNGERENPNDSIDFRVPVVTCPAAGWPVGSLSDYFNIRTGIAGLDVSALWHRAYVTIYNRWYRHQDLIDSIEELKDDGPDDATHYTLLRRTKRPDYFTKALKTPQKGPDVTLPLGISAPVYGNGKSLGLMATNASSSGFEIFGLSHNTGGANSIVTSNVAAYNQNTGTIVGTSDIVQGAFGVVPKQTPALESGLYADLTAATGASINLFRQALAFQNILELDTLGTRYPEILKNQFHVTTSDFRMQDPEYLGGGTTNVTVNPVLQTSSAAIDSPQGNLAAYAFASASNIGFSHFFEEHCILMGIVSARADNTYQQGVPRMFSDSTRYDFFLPPLAGLGPQPIYNREIYAQGTADDGLVFGYVERWEHLRGRENQISGVLRSDAPLSLQKWHFAQDFGNLPTLNQTFIEQNSPIARCISVTNQPQFISEFVISCKAARPVPSSSIVGYSNRL